ncbi:MAG: hypothetical protein Q9204_003251 [Flavoplaca sp. TL-2023a]
MAAESPQPQTIHSRIAALNLGHVGRKPITSAPIETEPLSRPLPLPRSQTTSLPASLNNGHTVGDPIGIEPSAPDHDYILRPAPITRTAPKKPPPALPPRKHSPRNSPALPPRRSSAALQRKDSSESTSSTLSTLSAMSVGSGGTARTSCSRTPSTDAGRKQASVFDHSSLPSVPQERTIRQVEKSYNCLGRSSIGLMPTKSTPNVTTTNVKSPPTLPSRLPDRALRTPVRTAPGGATGKPPLERPPTMPARSALSFGMNKACGTSVTDSENVCLLSTNISTAGPPPLPLSSKPDLSRLLATKPKLAMSSQLPSQPVPTTCLCCRDFSAPDNHAAKFPRESVPSIEWLAKQLVAPFASPTDQARVIFAWLHHNIAYDVVALCHNAVQPSTPANTLVTGLAVCEGYAGLFSAIASNAGLESLIVGGHGKGAGFSPLQPDQPIPAQYSTHAWNAVKIDNSEWKLVDSCWGAGSVCLREQKYNKRFATRHFTMDNDEFGLRHFPTNKSLFHRVDGRQQISWEEYIVGPSGSPVVTPVKVYEGVAEKEGVAETKVLPSNYQIPLSANSTIRFQFEKVCAHWDPIRNGPGRPYPYIMRIYNADSSGGEEFRVFDTNGSVWWLDVETRLLGMKGQTVGIFTVQELGGEDARGMSVGECRRAMGRKGWSGEALAAWELV